MTTTYNVNQPEAAVLLADKWNEDLPASAGDDLLTDSIVIAGSGRVAYLNVGFSSAVSAVLSVKRTRGSTTITQKLKAGAAVAVGTLHQETLYVAPGETINFGYADTGGKYYLTVGAVVQNG
jgi:hypothetical protein